MSVINDRKLYLNKVKQQFIVDAAINLIAVNGIDNIRMDDIARASNYTKRTLYTYFKSKEEIILWLFTDDLTSRWNYQQEQLLVCNTGLDKLNVWGTSLFEYYDKNPHSLQIQNYISYYSVHTDKVNESIFKRFKLINDELADGLRRIFDLGKGDGSFRKDLNMDITISQFLYSLRAILSRAFSDSYSFAEFDKSTYVKHFQNLFIRSIKG